MKGNIYFYIGRERKPLKTKTLKLKFLFNNVIMPFVTFRVSMQRQVAGKINLLMPLIEISKTWFKSLFNINVISILLVNSEKSKVYKEFAVTFLTMK